MTDAARVHRSRRWFPRMTRELRGPSKPVPPGRQPDKTVDRPLRAPPSKHNVPGDLQARRNLVHALKNRLFKTGESYKGSLLSCGSEAKRNEQLSKETSMKKGNNRGYGNILRAWAGLLALALFPLGAAAVQWSSGSDFVWNASTGKIDVFPGQGSGNMWAAGAKTPTSTGMNWTSPPKQLPFNPSPTFKFSSGFTPGAFAKAMMKGGALGFAAQSAIGTLINEACVRLAGGSMQLAEGGQWEECKFTEQTKWEYSTRTASSTNLTGAGSTGWQTSAQTACNMWLDTADNNLPAGVSRYMTTETEKPIGTVLPAVPGGDFRCKLTTSYSSPHPNAGQPPVHDYADVAIRTNGTTQVQDGYQPASESAAEARLTAALNAWVQRDFLYGFSPSNHGLDDLGNELFAGGRSVESTTSSVDPTSQTSITGTPKVTTSVTNNVTTTTTTTTTNNYGHTYNSPTNTITITHTTTTSTTTNNGSGTETTTTETEEKPPEDPCAKFPDRVGCKNLGTPEAGTIPTDSKTVSYTAEDLGLGSGSCPPPVSFSTVAGTHYISYQGACDFVETYMKPVALLIGALMALFILMPGRVEA